MTHRSSLLAACIANLLLACGGEATHNLPGGAGGALSAAAGNGPGGSSNGGSSNGGSAGAMLCCAAAPTCSAGERQAQSSECPGQASCRQHAICCSSIWCVADVTDGGSGGAGGAGGSEAHDCNGTACTATQACVAYRTVGGAFVPPEAGCPNGKHLEGGSCQADFAYKCVDLHGACQNEPLSCACAQPPTNNPGVCPVGFGSCSLPATAAVDASTELVCQQLAP